MGLRTEPAKIAAIIFDADGVVLDSERIWDRAQEEFLGRRGLVYRRSETKHLLTGAAPEEAIRTMQRLYGFPGDPEVLSRERLAIVAALYADGVPYMPGFLEFYQSVRHRYPTAVATSMNGDLLEIVDRGLKLRALFGGRVFTIAEVGGRGKPDPAIFLHAARQLGIPPEHCLVIEDAPNGIRAARAAGMRCVALATTHPAELLREADEIVSGFGEITLR